MTFGTDLKDQVPSILDYLGEGIASLAQFRAFIKEKSHIEREYAQKLENLTRKYKPNIKQQQKDEWSSEDNVNTGTTSAAWIQLLEQTSRIAKNRIAVADQTNQTVVDTLRDVIGRKEELRKKQTMFYQKLKNERDRTFSEKDKGKQLYDDACSEIENLKTKLAKTSDQEKIQKQLETAYLECDNKKNVYLLAIDVANAERAKYFEQDLPALADQLEELDAERIECLRNILKQYIHIETKSLSNIQQCHNDTLNFVEKLDPVIESGIFTRKALDMDSNERAANVTFSFMPWNGGTNAAETIIDRDDHLVTNDAAIIFLNNKLIKNRKRYDALEEEVSKKSTELNQLTSLVTSIQNKETADYDKQKEKLLDLITDLTLVSTEQVKVKSEIDLIIQHIGDDGLRAQNHDFKSSSFTIPTTCDYCNNTIWGLSNKGFTCRACGFNCHAKCEMKVAPNCSKTKGQVNPQPISITRSQSKATFQGSPNQSSLIPTSESTLTPSPTNSNSAFLSPKLPSSSIYEEQPTNDEEHADIRCLYSYDAQNEDELSIQEGDTLITLEPDDGSGWIKARRGHCVGLVPATYVEHLFETVVAIYDFEASNPEELHLKEGDIVTVIKKDDSGWWEGSLNGKVGIFPANYVQ